EVERLVSYALEVHGRVDVIVNNAGVAPIAPLAALDVAHWERMIDVNVKGLLYGVAAVLPIMQRQRGGHIVNLASEVGIKVHTSGSTVYSATKFAVRAITEGLRLEHAVDNIRCTMISPGGVAVEAPESTAREAGLRRPYAFASPAESIARAI